MRGRGLTALTARPRERLTVAAGVLTLVVTLLAAGGAWLTVGARLKLSEDRQVNDLLNLGAYYFLGLPVVFVVIFAIVG